MALAGVLHATRDFPAQPKAVVRESLGLPGLNKSKQTAPAVDVGTGQHTVF